jgi:hypothetical protein
MVVIFVRFVTFVIFVSACAERTSSTVPTIRSLSSRDPVGGLIELSIAPGIRPPGRLREVVKSLDINDLHNGD